MTDHITLPRSVVEQLKHALENANAFSPCPMYREAFIISRDALAAQQAEPVAWAKYDLDAMAEAFHRVIEAHHDKASPFANLINADACAALRILRGIIPAMKRYTAPKPAQPVAVPQEWVRSVMEQAQVFASAWAIAGGRFDSGDGMQVAEEEKESLRAMLNAAPTPPAATVPVLEPLTLREIAIVTEPWAHVRSDYSIGIVRAVEAAHAAKRAKRGGV